jgi:enediyne biosynthesis thioesterase
MRHAEAAAPAILADGARQRPGYSYAHVVGFEETNVVGNVYFARHIAWQGRCRELFLKEHAPSVLDDIAAGLRLVTLRTSCEYFEEIRAFDTIQVVMRLAHLRQSRIGLDFEYRRIAADPAVVAVGFQEICCMRAGGAGLTAEAPPAALEAALRAYQPRAPVE